MKTSICTRFPNEERAHTHAAATRTAKCYDGNSDAKLAQLRRRGAARFRRRALHQPHAHSPAAVALAVAPGRRRVKSIPVDHAHRRDLIHPLQADGAASTEKSNCTERRVSCAPRHWRLRWQMRQRRQRDRRAPRGAPRIIQPMTNGGNLPSLPASAPDPAQRERAQSAPRRNQHDMHTRLLGTNNSTARAACKLCQCCVHARVSAARRRGARTGPPAVTNGELISAIDSAMGVAKRNTPRKPYTF